MIVTTKLGVDPTGGKGIGRRAAKETIRTPIKEIYPVSLGAYTSRSNTPLESLRFAKIARGETAIVVDEVRDFSHSDNPLPIDQRESIRIQLVISALDIEPRR